MLRVSGEKVSRILAQQKLSQSSLAISSGLDKNTVNKIARSGQKGADCQESTVGILAEALGVNIEEVLVSSSNSSTPFIIKAIPLGAMERVYRRLDSTNELSYPGLLSDNHLRLKIISCFKKEAVLMLKKTDLYDFRNLIHSLTPATKSKSIDSLIASRISRLVKGSLDLPRSVDIISMKALLPANLTVRVMPSLLGTVVLFEYLRTIEGFDIDIKYIKSFSGTTERKRLKEVTDADLVTLPLITSTFFLKANPKSPYVPIMVLPRGTHRVLANNRGKQSKLQDKGATFLLLGTQNGTAVRYLNDLGDLGLVDVGQVDKIVCSEDLLLDHLKSRDDSVRSVLYFPYNIFYKIIYSMHYLDSLKLEVASKESYLFASPRIHYDESILSALLYVLHCALNKLKARDDLVELVVDLIFRDQDYIDCLSKGMGSLSKGTGHEK